MELPCTYTYRKNFRFRFIQKKLSELVADCMEDYQKRIKQIEEKKHEEKEKERRKEVEFEKLYRKHI